MQELIIILIIQCIVISIPWIVYMLFFKEKTTFIKWISKYNITKMEIIFIILCLFLIFLIETRRAIPFTLSLYLLIIFKNQITNNKIKIKKDKNFLYAFSIVFLVYIGIDLYLYFSNIEDTVNTINQYRIFIQLPLTLTIFLGYLFKVKLKDFNWSITLKSLICVICVFISLEIIYFLIYEINTLNELTLSYVIRNFVQKIYYPSIVEEVIFRGYLLSGLLAFGIREDKSNIIQAIIFGSVHILMYDEISIITFLFPCIQVYIGYIIGKIYLDTKSLTPCIILHALIDTI